jgi:hypothetical protein
MIRLYFNKHGERPWSVDQGTQATEKTFWEVKIHAEGFSRYEPLKPGQSSHLVPCAWIQFPGAKAVVSFDGGTCIIIPAERLP